MINFIFVNFHPLMAPISRPVPKFTSSSNTIWGKDILTVIAISSPSSGFISGSLATPAKCNFYQWLVENKLLEQHLYKGAKDFCYNL